MAQCDDYRIMKPSAFMLVPLKPRFHYSFFFFFFFCHLVRGHQGKGRLTGDPFLLNIFLLTEHLKTWQETGWERKRERGSDTQPRAPCWDLNPGLLQRGQSHFILHTHTIFIQSCYYQLTLRKTETIQLPLQQRHHSDTSWKHEGRKVSLLSLWNQKFIRVDYFVSGHILCLSTNGCFSSK